MTEQDTQTGTSVHPSWSRVLIATVGAVLHAVLSCAALVVAVRFAARPGESCDDAGPCFALNVTRMFRLIAALPLLYVLALVLWTAVLRILFRRWTGVPRRASSVAGLQVLLATPAIVLTLGTEGLTALVLFVTAAVVIPTALLWWATATTFTGANTRSSIATAP